MKIEEPAADEDEHRQGMRRPLGQFRRQPFQPHEGKGDNAMLHFNSVACVLFLLVGFLGGRTLAASSMAAAVTSFGIYAIRRYEQWA